MSRVVEKLLSQRLSGVGEYYFSRKLREIAKKSFNGEAIINLGIGSPDLPTSSAVIDRMHAVSIEANASKYQSYQGTPELRQAFTEWYQKYFDVKLDPDTELLPLIGSKEGIMHLSMALLDNGEEVLVPDPGYPTYSACAKLAGGNPRTYDLTEENGWLPNLEKLKKQNLENVKLMWVNYPNMPTGNHATQEFFRGLIELANEYEFVLVNDNPYSFILNEHRLSILSQATSNCLVLELNSLSKSHNMAGWRVGCLAGNPDLIKAALVFKSSMDSGMYLPIMSGAVEALNLPNTWYQEINETYKERRQYASEILQLLQCKFQEDQTGMFLWASIPESFENGEKLSDWLVENAGVFVTPGSVFGKNGETYIRISLCGSTETWQKSVERIRSAADKAKE